VQGLIESRELIDFRSVPVQGGAVQLPRSRDGCTPFGCDIGNPGKVAVRRADGQLLEIDVDCSGALEDSDLELADGGRLIAADVGSTLLRGMASNEVFDSHWHHYREDAPVSGSPSDADVAAAFSTFWQHANVPEMAVCIGPLAVWVLPSDSAQEVARVRAFLAALRKPNAQTWRMRVWELGASSRPTNPPSSAPVAEMTWRVIEYQQADQFHVLCNCLVDRYVMAMTAVATRDMNLRDDCVGVAGSFVSGGGNIEASVGLREAIGEIEKFDTKAAGKGTVIVQRRPVRVTELHFSGTGTRLEAAVARDGVLLYGLLEKVE